MATEGYSLGRLSLLFSQQKIYFQAKKFFLSKSTVTIFIYTLTYKQTPPSTLHKRSPIEKLDVKNDVKNDIKNDVKNYVKNDVKNDVKNWDSFLRHF